MDFTQIEASDGVRMAWNYWPTTRVEAARMVVPLSAVYTPLKSIESMPLVQYQPVGCKGAQCGGVLNPYCRVDFNTKSWTCPFCLARNQFPPNYASISENSLPAELFPNYSTIEYTLPRKPALPPVFLLVVDTCITKENIESLRSAIERAITQLPEQALIGLITYGTTVQVHELGFDQCPKSYVFRGSKAVAPEQVHDLLGFASQMRGDPTTPGSRRFILPVSECEFTLTTILGELQADPWPVPPGNRPLRCTGTAISVAVSLMEKAFPNTGGRILVFCGGATTAGPGMIVTPDLKEKIRTHFDMENNTSKHTKAALKYYKEMGVRAGKNGHAIDLFCCSLDQAGLMEMGPCVEETGGSFVMSESFKTDVFKESLKTLFLNEESSQNLRMTFGNQIRVVTSREFKVCGAIGPCTSLGKKSSCVGETAIGQGGTCEWLIGACDPTVSLSFYFELNNQQQTQITEQQQRTLQFLTTYQHSSGQYRLRVTTLQQPWAVGANAAQMISAGFDQEAAVVAMARIAVFKTRSEESFDILRWLDRTLIRTMSKFANYRKDDPSTFQVGPQFSMYPQFMFYLRRSPLLQVFNSSPDETVYYRTMMLRADVTNTLTMILPSLVAYSLNAPPTPVMLDSASVVPDRILLLDTFFQVVVFYGSQIAEWRDAGYQDQPGYENFKELLGLPVSDAQTIMQGRFPHPMYIDCDEGGSAARFLLYVLNPSCNHLSNQGGTAVISDDVTLEVFEDHLRRLSVQD